MNKRIVVKVGSAVLTNQNDLAHDRMRALVKFLVDLRAEYEVILVSSGAVAAGFTQMEMDRTVIANRQALAAIGQPRLMHEYQTLFSQYGVLTAQILVTSANFRTFVQYSHISDNLETLLKAGVMPIINENDSTATEELVFGDNDQLSADVARYSEADILLILSDIDAFYDKDPHKYSDAKVRKVVTSITKEELTHVTTPHSEFATGGIVTKLQAADLLLCSGKKMFLASGYDLSDARSFFLNATHKGGTLFTPKELK